MSSRRNGRCRRRAIRRWRSSRRWRAWHAAWWDHPDLGETVGTWASTEDSAQHMEIFAGHYDRFADLLGDRLSEERRILYRRLIEQSARLSQRYHSRRHVSITHGDAHIWNFLLPRAGVADTVRIFDFDLWGIDVPTDDLAYMMAMQWYPERRQALERSLLNRLSRDADRTRRHAATREARSTRTIACRCSGTSPSRSGSGASTSRR